MKQWGKPDTDFKKAIERTINRQKRPPSVGEGNILPMTGSRRASVSVDTSTDEIADAITELLQEGLGLDLGADQGRQGGRRRQ